MNFTLQIVFQLLKYLTPRFPLRQIGAFRSLRRDCTRLRDHRMSLIESKGRAAVFISLNEAGTSVKSRVLSHFKKICAMIFINFTFFSLCERIV